MKEEALFNTNFHYSCLKFNYIIIYSMIRRHIRNDFLYNINISSMFQRELNN